MTTPTLADLLPPPCCCRDTPTCDDCEPRTGNICMRVRHEDWPEGFPSLWLIVPVIAGRDQCGYWDITDQYSQSAEAFGPWSFDYHADAEDYTATCVAIDPGDGSRWEPAPGIIVSAAWSVYASCSLIRFGLWETQLTGNPSSPFPSGNPFFDPDSIHYVGEPDYEAYVSADWHETSFSVGPWQISPAATCEVDAIGPCCLRVTATGVDTQCRFARSEELPFHDGPMPPPTVDCDTIILGNVFGETGSPCGGQFAGSLSNVQSPGTSSVVVWWEINADKTEITLNVDGDSATFDYEEDWWLTSRTVGDYTVSQCFTYEDCDAYLCYPVCVVNTNCPSNPSSINAAAVFITANDGATDHDGTATWSNTTSEYTFSFDVGALCGTLSGRIYCDGSEVKVDFDLFDGFVHTYATFTVDWECVDGDVSWTTPTAVSGIACALDITLWTNNSGAG